MTTRQLQRLDQHLKQWRAAHPDAASLRAAYRARVLEFTLNSMAMENEPVEPKAVEALRTRPGR
jgi:hypothetical protein